MAPPLPAPRSAERRQVTALFCDLVDSVSLTVRLGAEDMMHVVDVYLSACDDIISGLGGTITQYMGDGVLAYFGYPRANEDDAANAVRAALALREAVGRLALFPGLTLQLRIGIATGQVVVSDLVGRGKERHGVVGETPNLAARLQSAAPPNGILVARSTQRISRGLFRYRDLETFQLKGFAEPVQASEVIEAVAIDSRFLARAQGEAAPMVGRDSELTLIRGCWAAACAGRGRVVLLQGEAGIGKVPHGRGAAPARRRYAACPDLLVLRPASGRQRAAARSPDSWPELRHLNTAIVPRAAARNLPTCCSRPARSSPSAWRCWLTCSACRTRPPRSRR